MGGGRDVFSGRQTLSTLPPKEAPVAWKLRFCQSMNVIFQQESLDFRWGGLNFRLGGFDLKQGGLDSSKSGVLVRICDIEWSTLDLIYYYLGMIILIN